MRKLYILLMLIFVFCPIVSNANQELQNDIVSKFKSSFKKQDISFPPAPKYKSPKLKNPDVSISISKRTIKSVLEQIIGDGLKVSFSGKKEKRIENDYIEIKSIEDVSFTDENTIKLVGIYGEVHFSNLLEEATFPVKSITIELVPSIEKIGGKFLMAFDLAVTELNIFPGADILNKALASLLLAKPLTAGDLGIKEKVDITKTLVFNVVSPWGGGNINPPLTDAWFVIDEQSLFFQAVIKR